jgi:hypothetical protein
MSKILATQEAEIRRIQFKDSHRQIVRETPPISKKRKSHTHTHKRAGKVAQGVGPEFKPQYHKKQNKQTKRRV